MAEHQDWINEICRLLGLPNPGSPSQSRFDLSGSSRRRSSSSGSQPKQPGSGRIEWGPTPTPEPPAQTQSPPQPPQDNQCIEWDQPAPGGLPDISALVGVEDALEHTPLLPGEKVAFCNRDRVAYHLATWQFLREQNGGRCCICGNANVFTFLTLPGTLPPVIPQPQAGMHPGAKIIGLPEVHEYVNLAVTVQDYVHGVHRTKNGTYFIRFEPRLASEPVFAGFKAVIFKNYVPRWESAGIDISSYQWKTVRLRGIIREHETWGIEILAFSPAMIQVVESEEKG